MPFLKKTKTHDITYSNGRPVSAIVTFKGCGEFIPLYICYEDDSSELHKVRIEAIKYIRDKHGIKSFCCVIAMHHRTYEILLEFIIMNHQWILI